MEESKKKYQPNIMSAIDELQRCYRKLNAKYYGGELEDVVITIQSDPRKMAYAWITIGKAWNDKTENWYHEINMVAEYLNRDPDQVIASLLHEMAHLYNIMKGVQDCSRGGQYHNSNFKETAENHGLIAEHDKRYGWVITKATEETKKWVSENVRSGCFRMKRGSFWADGKPKKSEGEDGGRPKVTKKGGSNIRKYVCPKCGLIIRASKDITGKVCCVECLEILIESK